MLPLTSDSPDGGLAPRDRAAPGSCSTAPVSFLAQQQKALIATLFDWPCPNATQFIAAHAHQSSVRGLKAYQANGHMLAERALLGAYPVLAQLLGSESFADLARALWHTHPPTRGDVARWGAELADYLAGDADLRSEPYLVDVARVEWALHCCATAPNAVPAPDTLALLTHADPDHVQLQLCPATAVLASAWPVVSILGAHHDASPSLEQAGALVRQRVSEDVVVWRNGFKPCVRQAMEGELPWIQALKDGQSLGQALDAAPALDFSSWLAQALQSGLLVSVRARVVAKA